MFIILTFYEFNDVQLLRPQTDPVEQVPNEQNELIRCLFIQKCAKYIVVNESDNQRRKSQPLNVDFNLL